MRNENHKIVFLFTGQGSHYRGMGEKLYRSNPVFAQSLEKSDALFQDFLGRSLLAELYHTPEKVFDDLLITHPAIVAVEIAMLDLMNAMEIVPDYISGNSLGAFAAAVASGVWTREMALEAAIEQAKSIVQNAPDGGMLAVINESKDSLKELAAENKLYLASQNFSTHHTFSGAKENIDNFQDQLKSREISFTKLPVTYPFHSPLIDAGKTDFLYYTYTAPQLKKPAKGFISGLYSKELHQLPEDYFWQVISQPTDFTQLVDYMEAQGSCIYLDLGPSGTAATFVKYNLSASSRSQFLPIMTPFEREREQLQTLQDRWMQKEHQEVTKH